MFIPGEIPQTFDPGRFALAVRPTARSDQARIGYDFAMNVGQAEVAAGIAIGQTFVVESRRCRMVA